MSKNSFIASFFTHKASRYIDVDEELDEKNIERKIVSRLSRGNVSLQSGRYITKKEIDARYEKIKQHSFIGH